MTVFRSPMEKILQKHENETVVTNPKEPVRTFFRKVVFRFHVLRDRLGRIGRRRPGGPRG